MALTCYAAIIRLVGRVPGNGRANPFDVQGRELLAGAARRVRGHRHAGGAPGSGTGKALLAPAQNGLRLEFAATVEFKVPLVGGSIESYIGGHAVKSIAATQEFTTAWIT